MRVNGYPGRLTAYFITPVLRWQRKPFANGVAPFFDLGVGASYFDETRLLTRATKSVEFVSHFQFEDKLAFGIEFGERQRGNATLMFFHYSNGDRVAPNDRIDLYGLGVAWHF